jgi:hypothetical protein
MFGKCKTILDIGYGEHPLFKRVGIDGSISIFVPWVTASITNMIQTKYANKMVNNRYYKNLQINEPIN